MEISIPRDREDSFEPRIIEKHQTRFYGFFEKIISMYASGMSTRDISNEIKNIYMKLTKASKKWHRPVHNRKATLNHFAILFEERM